MKHINYNTHLKKQIYSVNYDLSCQKQYIYNAFHQTSSEPHLHCELKKKFSSYIQQDKLKKRYTPESHITYTELIQKLYDCSLTCYYCKTDLCILYEHRKTPNQWSLERFNNMLGHSSLNTCIACLRCNLQRRNENHIYFKDSKQMKVTRLEWI